ncbi:MAG: CPBP family intramembrane metalloprotease, partial [Lachnospiraceae bacterium]|nr:CPBP family intramembrane metalloprotease [Lachnospiraceae bacterium]
MTRLYKKSESTFAILWIVAYVVLTSLADQLSESIGITKSVTAALHVVMSLILFFWIRKNHLSEKYGFGRSVIPAKRFLYYFPLIITASTAFWYGIKLQYGFPEALLFFISMCCVGFLEEVIFRGLLFRAMEKDNLKIAIIVSALTFGLGHVVNLFNGSGQDIQSTIVQVVFAVLVGFVLVLIFYHGKSLVPCIVFHSANNALRVFSAEGSLSPQAEMILNLLIIVVVLGGYLLYLIKAFSKKAG